MKDSDIVIGFSGHEKFEIVHKRAEEIVGSIPIVFVNFHDPDIGFGGITTTIRSMRKIIKNLIIIHSTKDTNVRHENNKYAVYLSPELITKYQNYYGKRYLWPLLHGLKPDLQNKELKSSREATIEASRIFAIEILAVRNKLLKKYNEEPVLWLNDYLLIPTVSELRMRCPSLKIIFSNRSSFKITKTSELAQEDKALLFFGMCAADFISFHRKRDVNNFMSALEDFIDTEDLRNKYVIEEDATISVNDHKMIPRAVPMGNDPYYRTKLSKDRRTKEFEKVLKKIAKGKKIIASVSSFEMNKGIIEELDIIESFFSSHPAIAKKCVFIRVMPIRSNYDNLFQYQKLKATVLTRIEQINKKYASDNGLPIVAFTDPVGFDDYQVSALQNLSYIYLVLSKADGFNHSSIEFLLTKSVSRIPGYLILSDIGATDYLGNNLNQVDPDNTEECAELLASVIAGPSHQVILNQKKLQKAARSLSTYHWALSVLASIINPSSVPLWKLT